LSRYKEKREVRNVREMRDIIMLPDIKGKEQDIELKNKQVLRKEE
jgi:hypothetical protein